MISSVSNPVIRRVRRLRKRTWRERKRLVLLEGHRTVTGALAAGARMEELFVTPGAAPRREALLDEVRTSGAKVREVTPEVMAHLTSATTAPDLLGICPFTDTRLETLLGASAVVLSPVHDPAAAGAIALAGAAVGMGGIVFGSGSVDAFSPKTMRAARGAHYSLRVVRDVDGSDAAQRLSDAGGRLVALVHDSPAPWEMDLTGPLVLVVADEEGGVPAKAERVGLPGAGPGLSASAAVVLYEWLRQGGPRDA